MENINNVVEINEEEITMEAEVQETKTEGFMSKVVGGVKKHGKTILKGVVIGAVGLLAYGIGKKSGKIEVYEDYVDGETAVEFEVVDEPEVEVE